MAASRGSTGADERKLPPKRSDPNGRPATRSGILAESTTSPTVTVALICDEARNRPTKRLVIAGSPRDPVGDDALPGAGTTSPTSSDFLDPLDQGDGTNRPLHRRTAAWGALSAPPSPPSPPRRPRRPRRLLRVAYAAFTAYSAITASPPRRLAAAFVLSPPLALRLASPSPDNEASCSMIRRRRRPLVVPAVRLVLIASDGLRGAGFLEPEPAPIASPPPPASSSSSSTGHGCRDPRDGVCVAIMVSTKPRTASEPRNGVPTAHGTAAGRWRRRGVRARARDDLPDLAAHVAPSPPPPAAPPSPSTGR